MRVLREKNGESWRFVHSTDVFDAEHAQLLHESHTAGELVFCTEADALGCCMELTRREDAAHDVSEVALLLLCSIGTTAR